MRYTSVNYYTESDRVVFGRVLGRQVYDGEQKKYRYENRVRSGTRLIK